MKRIQWDESISISIAGIDRQHQKIFELMNKLNNAMRKGKGKDLLANILNELADYTETHLREEEKYFALFGYSGASGHEKEHWYFESKVADFKNRLATDQLSVCIELLFFLSDWFRNHIQQADRKYVPLFQANGVN